MKPLFLIKPNFNRIEKYTLLFLFLLPLSIVKLHAQNYRISFRNTKECVPIDSVYIENLNQNKEITVSGSEVLHLMKVVAKTEYSYDVVEKLMRVYPNPSNDYFILEFGVPNNELVKIGLYDVLGKEINRFSTHLSTGSHSFKLSGLNAGFYLVRVIFNNQSFSKKLTSSASYGTIPNITYNGALQDFNETMKLKSNSTRDENVLQYNAGDILRFTGKSGGYMSVVTDSPSMDEIISFSFVESKLIGSSVPTEMQVADTVVSNSWPSCFNAVNELTVAGDGTSVVVEPEATANFIAGQSIRFLPGFHAYEGSYLNGYITTTEEFCEENSLPSVTTTEITNIVQTIATSGGNITDNGGTTITARGVCWNTTGSPTIYDSVTSDGTGTGSFTSSITGLSANTTYYVRAYATNIEGTAYGNEIGFTTICDCEDKFGTFTDIRDGHTYNTIEIGTQTWMAENLAYLPQVSAPSNSSNSEEYYYVYGYYGSNVSEAKNVSQYNVTGVLYNYTSAIDVCPVGFHLPSKSEWLVLINFLGGEQDAGGKMKACEGWNTPNVGADNSSCFTGLSGGVKSSTSTDFAALGNIGWWWSSTQDSNSNSFMMQLTKSVSNCSIGSLPKSTGASVRCIKD